jgi:hypothetical protein
VEDVRENVAEHEQAASGSSAAAGAVKVNTEVPSEETGEWAVVEVKRKKRQQFGNIVEAPVGSCPESIRQSTFAARPPPSSQSGGPLHHQVEVGIEDDSEFRVVKRLIGPGGEHMQRITETCLGTKVELRGTGTKSLGGSAGPLVLHIKGHDAAQCAKALAQAQELVADIRNDYEAFVASRLTEAMGGDGQEQGSAKVDHPVDTVDSQEESTSADGSVHALNDATDSDADDAIAGNLDVKIASQDVAEPAISSKNGGGDAVSSSSTPFGKRAVQEDRRKPVGRSPAVGASQFSGPLGRPAAIGPPIHHEVHVGIEHSLQFPVVRRLIGPGGEHMRNISTACPGTKVELRGAGTNPWLGDETGPLVLHIRGRDPVQCSLALKLANELVEGVRKEHQEFVESKPKR